MATEPRIQLPPGAPGPLARAMPGRGDLEQWKDALRNVRDNPLAAAFELARKRRLARISWLRRQGLPVFFVILLSATITTLMIYEPSMRPSLREAPWLMLLFIGVPLYGIWLLRGIYELALLSQQLLGISGRRAAHLQMDDMLALTPLSGAEMVAGVWWAVVRPMLPIMIGGGVLIWLLSFGIALQFGDTVYEDQARVLVMLGFAPLTIGCITLSSALALSTLSLWWIAMGRALKADQLSVSGALIYGVGQIIWIPATLALLSDVGFNGFYEHNIGEDFLLALLAGAVLLFGVYLMLGAAEQSRGLRAGLAAIGPLLPLIVAFAFFGTLTALWAEELGYLFGDSGNFFERMMPAILLSWGALVPVDPLAIPHPVLLGYIDDPSANMYGGSYPDQLPWPSPLQFIALLLTQIGVLAACARGALRSVELRRRAL